MIPAETRPTSTSRSTTPVQIDGDDDDGQVTELEEEIEALLSAGVPRHSGDIAEELSITNYQAGMALRRMSKRGVAHFSHHVSPKHRGWRLVQGGTL